MLTFNHSSGSFLKVKGAKIYYETAGFSDGSPLLLLHGGLGSMSEFNSFAHSLPSQYKLIGIDFRGHGKSTLGTCSLSYAQHQEDVEAVLAHLGIDSVSIIGLSDGGIVGYRMSSQSNVKVERLATLGAQWRLLPDDPTLPMLQGVTTQMWTEMFPESVADYETINPQPDFDALVRAVVALWTDMGPTGYPNSIVESIQSLVMIIRGDNDHLFSLDEATRLKNLIRRSSFLNIPFAGHAVYEDSPEIFIQMINEFLTRPAEAE